MLTSSRTHVFNARTSVGEGNVMLPINVLVENKRGYFFFCSNQAAVVYPLRKDAKLAAIIGQPFERRQGSDRRNAVIKHSV